jgi:hypothetical protein
MADILDEAGNVITDEAGVAVKDEAAPAGGDLSVFVSECVGSDGIFG